MDADTPHRDLSLVHGAIVDENASRQPRSPNEWKAFELSPEQIGAFRERGFLSGVRLLDDAGVDGLLDELARLADPKHAGNDLFYEFHSNEAVDPSKVLFHAIGAWRIEPGFHDLLWNPAFCMAAHQLLEGPVRQFHDQIFSKPAQDGGVVAWHQDYSYWTWTQPLQHLSCWVALDDVSTENGCLYYVPGSHRWGLLPITGLTGDMDAVREVLDDEQIAAFEARVPIELRRGEAAFHHPLLMHGSYDNRSDRPRRAVVLNVVRDGVVSNRDALPEGRAEELNFPILPQGEKLDGQFYPLLFDPEKELETTPSGRS